MGGGGYGGGGENEEKKKKTPKRPSISGSVIPLLPSSLCYERTFSFVIRTCILVITFLVRVFRSTALALTQPCWKYKEYYIRKEGRTFVFNYALNKFYLRLKDHSDSERRNPLPPLGLRFLISRKGSFIYTIPQTG